MVKLVLVCVAALATGACTTLTAADEAKSLRVATAELSDALVDTELSLDRASTSYRSERAEIDTANGRPVRWETECTAIPRRVADGLTEMVGEFYRTAQADRIYSALPQTPTCGFIADEGGAALSPLRPSAARREIVATLDADSLPGAARSLEAYAVALADVATGESAARSDIARARLVVAGKGLASAVKMPAAADAVLDLANAVAGSVIAARRNATTRAFLDRYDPYVPAMMEQVGMAARLATAQALLGRTRTASDIADHANRVLNRRDMIATRGGTRFGTAARMTAFEDLALRVETQNSAIRALRVADPMAAARDFAEAHRVLTAVFNDPKASRGAALEGLAAFRASAAALATALKTASS